MQSWAQTITLLVGIGATLVAAIVYQTHYVDKAIEGLRNKLKADLGALRTEFKAEIKALRELMDERFKRVDEQFKYVNERLERLEHPIVRTG